MRVRIKCLLIPLLSLIALCVFNYTGNDLVSFGKTQPFVAYFNNTIAPEILSPNQSQKLYKSLENDDSIRFHRMWRRWRSMLVSEDYDEQNAAVVKYAQTLSERAEDVYESLNKSLDREDLWPARGGDSPSAHFTTRFRKLLLLSRAFATNGTGFHRDRAVLSSIKEGLKSMTTEQGYDGRRRLGNWWHFQIGAAHAFIAILMVLREELDDSEAAMYAEVISGYVPDPYRQVLSVCERGELANVTFNKHTDSAGANRADLALTVLALGILQEDPKKVQQACESVKPLLGLVRAGDGFYADGSYIQHGHVPQTGSYGSVLAKSVSTLLYVIRDSYHIIGMNRNTVEMFVETVERAFVPLLHEGKMLHMVMGRSVSRYPVNEHVGFGIRVLYILLLVAEIAPGGSGRRLKEAVKYWMNEDPDYYVQRAEEYIDLAMCLSLLHDTSIAGDRPPFVGTKMYASMDRFVQRTASYVVALALYSRRVVAFEAGNSENKRGWHSADGVLYLYNDDGVQFAEAYWPTVDAYRPPGATVDTVKLRDEVSFFDQSFRSAEKWVGGVANDGQAVVGMALNKLGFKNNGVELPMNLRGKKSWFVVDGLVAALGAGINGDTNASIETVVDDRMLSERLKYRVLVSEKFTASEGRLDWLLLDADRRRASIGYYFPQKETVFITKELRSGHYSKINGLSPNLQKYSAKYFKCLIRHGRRPRNASYAYVLLPGVDRSGIVRLHQKGAVNILVNTEAVQAVELKEHGYLGVNVWAERGGAAGGVAVDQPASLLRRRRGELTEYSMADPTQSDRVTSLRVPKDFAEVVSMSEGVTFDGGDTFTFDFKRAAGAGKTVVVK